MAFTPSKSLLIVARIGHYRVTQDASVPDFSLWRDGAIIAQGGQALMMRLFNEIEKGFDPQGENNVRDDLPSCGSCGRDHHICLCDGSGAP